MLPLILEMPSSNRVVKFTNILNLSAIKFHIPSVQFLRGIESSAATGRAGSVMASQGVQSGQLQEAWTPCFSGDSTANWLFHRLNAPYLPRGIVKVTTGSLKREYCIPKPEAGGCCGANTTSLTLHKICFWSISYKLIYSLIRRL